MKCVVALIGCVALALLASPVDARPLEGTYAGTSSAVGIDSDQDGTHASESDHIVQLKGFGRATADSVGELGAWDGSSFCSDGPPGTVRVTWVQFSEVWTFENFDQLQFSASLSDSYLCARPDGSYYGVLAGNATGGTGRFSGATGNLIAAFEGYALPNAVGHSRFRGTIAGSIE